MAHSTFLTRVRHFLVELKRRKVYRVGVAYIVVGFAVAQGAEYLFEMTGLPIVISRTVAILLLLGLPLALALAWAYEVRPEGRTSADRDSPGALVPESHEKRLPNEVRSTSQVVDADVGALVRSPSVPEPGTGTTRRLIVLPFRVLNPDSETDFFALALPDAITCSLAGLRSLIVRSSVASARFDATTDLRIVAQEAHVDVVLTGTLQRGGPVLEIRTQLADARDGTVLSSQTLRGRVEDLFLLQDRVTRRIVESLDLPLTDGEKRRLAHDIPSSPHAYELYLRGNQTSVKAGQWDLALELYEACLNEDPSYAPAWARAGRCHRLIGKYALDPAVAEYEATAAGEAFSRALALNPDLHIARSFLADFEVDSGHAEKAVVRLLELLNTAGHQPEVLAGLVQACRFCGLLEPSKQAARLAKQADPRARTSEAHTYFMSLEYAEAIRTYNEADIGYMEAVALTALGRGAEAGERIRQRALSLPEGSIISFYLLSLRQLLDGRTEESAATINAIAGRLVDGEAIYYLARQLAHMGYTADAIRALERSAARGFFCHPMVSEDPWLDSVRAESAFSEYAGLIRERHERAAQTFVTAGGVRLLGPVFRDLPTVATPEAGNA